LPAPNGTHASPQQTDTTIVYAPVALSTLSPVDAQHLKASATEAWVSRADLEQERGQGHRRRHSHHQHHQQNSRLAAGLSQSDSQGQISLPIREGEPLLPGYEDLKE